MISLVLFGSLVVLLILNVPVSISLGIASLITILVSGDLTSGYIVQNLVTSADSFTTMSIPFLFWQERLWEAVEYLSVS